MPELTTIDLVIIFTAVKEQHGEEVSKVILEKVIELLESRVA